MITRFRLPVLLALAALSAVRLSAASSSSLQVDTTIKPMLPATMLMDGVTQGRVIIAISVNEKGELVDTLVLGYTHRALVGPCVAALKDWKYTPPVIDGTPVPVQTDLTIDFRAEGVVVSASTASEIVATQIRRFMADRYITKPCAPRDLDAAPTRVTTVMPHYAREAELKGIRGTVQVHFYIDQAGSVRMPAVDPGSDPYLSSIAVTALREWKFQPCTSRGSPVLVAAVQDFKFGQ